MELLEVFKRYGIIGLLIIVILIISILYAKLRFAETERDLARSQLTVLKVQIEQQNTAIAEWKKQTDLQNVRLNAALQDAQTYRTRYQNEAQSLLLHQVPTDCMAAIDWAARMAKELSANF